MSNPSHQARPRLENLEDRLALSSTRFISTLYERVLHRPGSAAEVQSWDRALNNGVAPAQVALSFLNCAERRGHEVDELYTRILNRGPDAGGRAGFVQALQNGASTRDVVRAMILSAEYRAAHGTDDSFVRGLYEDILRRGADDTGLEHWKAEVHRSGDHAQVVDAFFTSREHYQQVAGGMYTELLHRSGTLPEKDGWASALIANGGQIDPVAHAFLRSHEFEIECEYEIEHSGGHS